MTTIAVTRDRGTAILTLSNPGARNALTLEMWWALARAVRSLDHDPGVAAIILRGEGEDFSSGADILSLPSDPVDFHRAHLAAETALAEATTPTIAAIRGHCIGGGCEIAVASAIRFADPTARFGITASRLGIVYPEAPTRRLVDLVGPGTARLMLFGGEIFDAPWAERVGLITELVPDPDAAAATFAALLTRRSRTTIAGAAHHTRGATSGSAPHDCTDDFHEGVRAFRERRPARFPSTTGVLR